MIHYHGTPMTPEKSMVQAFQGRHAMVSFFHPAQIDIATEICHSVALDNGAFSAWMAKKDADFDGYAAWAQQWLKHPAVDWCLIPDVIDGEEDDNDRLLDEWPLDGAVSVPVWHLHESMDRLERLICAYPRIAFGSSGKWREVNTPAWWHRMAEAMEVTCDGEGMPRCKLHGLRMLDPTVFSHLPFASADSCNVARNVGIDQAWNGPYAPRSRAMRALIMMERIEAHASSRRWNSKTAGIQSNLEMIG